MEAVKKHAQKPLDVHLMIVDLTVIKEFKEKGADGITVHYEACTQFTPYRTGYKRIGLQGRVALNPHTPVALLGRYYCRP